MKGVAVVFLTVGAVALTGCLGPRAEVSYMQWNIGHFALGTLHQTKIKAEESDARAEAYRAMIAKHAPDVIGISEWSDKFDLAGAATTNKIFSTFPTRLIGPSHYYQWNATMAKYPLKSSRVVPYDQHYQNVYYIDGVYEIAGREVHIVQTHLDWDCDGEKGKCGKYRASQIAALVEAFKDCPYVIISGDFNVLWREEYEPFRAAGFTLVNYGELGEFFTVPVRGKTKYPEENFGRERHDRGIDNIFCKGFTLAEAWTDDVEKKLSDHYILGAKLLME